MTVFDELKARGLLAQLTDEEEIKELINNGKATFYIGFDPTAADADGRQQADRLNRRRYRHGR